MEVANECGNYGISIRTNSHEQYRYYWIVIFNLKHLIL